MNWKLYNFDCEGCPKGTGTWIIQYSFKSGVNPTNGKGHGGTNRTCYVPNCQEGKEVLALLVKAFRRKLTFTIGFSVTNNKDNCIVWNIHHKTNTGGGTNNYGFPDPTYFKRVKDELNGKGVVIDPESNEISEVCQNLSSVIMNANTEKLEISKTQLIQENAKKRDQKSLSKSQQKEE